jgi:hypothetical protein
VQRVLRIDAARGGEATGQAAVVLRQLERRFGPLPEEARARIASASSDEILAMADRLLSAEDLDSVFG